MKTNDHGQMLLPELEQAIQKTLDEGKIPFFVNATAGTTLLGAFDDFHGIANICEKYQIWMHVDGCLGSSAILSKKYSHLLDGTERAQSLSWNPHKTLGVPLQCMKSIYQSNLNIIIIFCRLTDYFQREIVTFKSKLVKC